MTTIVHGLDYHGDVALLQETHPYLFRAASMSDPLPCIQREMAILNDFCFTVLEAQVKAHSQKLTWQMIDTETANPTGSTFEADLLDMLDDGENQYYYDSVRYGSDDINVLFGPAMVFMLLWAFTVKSLIRINKKLGSPWLEPEGGESELRCQIKRLDRRLGGSTVERFCQDNWELNNFLNQIRKIRNQFAHGNWKQCEQEIAITSIRGSFGSVTTLLTEIQTHVIPRLRISL